MKVAAIVLAAVILVLALTAWIAGKKLKRSNPSVAAGSPKHNQNDIYPELRNQILNSSRSELGLTKTSDPKRPWGVVMDWGLTDGTATVIALSDGEASVYLSGGSGYIGGQTHEAIRKAAQNVVSMAAEFQPKMHATTTYPLPQSGDVTFYILTDNGTFTASASEEDLKKNRNPLTKLANAAQDVITQYRLQQSH